MTAHRLSERARALGGALACLGAVCGSTAAQADDTAAREVFRMHDQRITESSSLVVSATEPGLAYTANDSGDAPRVYAVDMGSGDTVGVTTLGGVEAIDIEAMAPGPADRLYIADIGDNREARPFVQVYWIQAPVRETAVVQWRSAKLVYPDRPHNAEAILVDPATGRLFVVSKDLLGGVVYQAPATLAEDRVNWLEPVGAAPRLITDAAFLPSGLAVLRSYGQAYVCDPVDWSVLSRTELPSLRQGESIAALPGSGDVLVGTEGSDSQVFRVTLEAVDRDDDPSSDGPDGQQGSTDEASGNTGDGDPVDDSPVWQRKSTWAVTAGVVVALAALAGGSRAWRARG